MQSPPQPRAAGAFCCLWAQPQPLSMSPPHDVGCGLPMVPPHPLGVAVWTTGRPVTVDGTCPSCHESCHTDVRPRQAPPSWRGFRHPDDAGRRRRGRWISSRVGLLRRPALSAGMRSEPGNWILPAVERVVAPGGVVRPSRSRRGAGGRVSAGGRRVDDAARGAVTVWDAGGMSDYSDDTLDRYHAGRAEARRAYLEDPVQHAQIELQRQLLDAADRAMALEGMSEEARHRVVNRIVWGDPEGLVDVHAQTFAAAVAARDACASLVDECRLSTRPRIVGGAP